MFGTAIIRSRPLIHILLMHIPPSTYAASVAPASRACLLARFARMFAFLSSKTAVCFWSIVSSQYPKLAPHPAKTGHTHRDPRLNMGRISRPSCHSRVATPNYTLVSALFFLPPPSWQLLSCSRMGSVHTEARPEEDAGNHVDVCDWCRPRTQNEGVGNCGIFW